MTPRRLFPVLALWLALTSTAGAGLSERDLAQVAVKPAPGALAPLDLAFVDENGRRLFLRDAIAGRPTLLVLADYKCRLICGPILVIAASAARESGLRAGRDFNFVVVGIDAHDDVKDAAAMKEAQLGGDAELARAARFLTGDAESIGALERSIGYRAIYDDEARRFAHPVDMLALRPNGQIAQVLSGLSARGEDLRVALTAAEPSLLDSLAAHAAILCYGLGPENGRYRGAIQAAILGVSGATLGGLGAFAFFAQRRRKRRFEATR